MAVKLGTNPIAWSNDDMPELGGDTPLDTCLKEAAEAGFKGIEKGGKFPNDAASMQAVLGKHGLELISGWFSGELLGRGLEAEIEALRPHLELLKSCGAKLVIWAETTGTVQGRRDVPVADRPVMREADWPDYLRSIAKLADWMAENGMPMAFHHHMGTVIDAEEVGLKKAMGERYAKAKASKRSEFIQALLAVEGFTYKGAVPKAMRYPRRKFKHAERAEPAGESNVAAGAPTERREEAEPAHAA